ncbi:MAG: aldehyde ferredoxin oxidoreductase C-terminal domain-containing protein, partial [Chloroflexota bacterium]
MAIEGGYQGKLLEVDLTRGQTRAVPLPSEDVLRTWIGGTGLGMHLLAKEMIPGMKTTDPDAPCFVITGPLTGTLVPQSSNWTIVNLRYAPDYCVGVSHAHGYFGARLKHAGWDGIVLRGASAEPVYLWIDDDKVELRDARPYWGHDTYETPRQLKIDLRDPLGINVACIGPGGENLLLGATVRADGAFTCGMGDAGMAWGSKRLKAIAVRGSGRVPIADYATLDDVCTRWNAKLYGKPLPPPDYHARFRFIANYGASGGVPAKNFTEPELGEVWCKSLREEYPKWKVRPVGSWQCEMLCHHETTVTTGPLAGGVAMGFGSEVFEEVGPNVGIMDAGTSMALAGLVDGLGVNSGETPRAIAMVMEAYNKGLVTREQLDGIDLRWGNYEGVVELLHKAVQREGIGALLAMGIRETSRKLGIEELAVHTRGVGFQGHDWRPRPGALFSRIVASGGGSGQEVNGLFGVFEGDSGQLKNEGAPDAGYEQPFRPDAAKDVGLAMFRGQCLMLWQDTIGVCKFGMTDLAGIVGGVGTQAVDAAVGWKPFDRDEALLVGERTINLQRLISLYRGYQPESDFDISERLLSIPSGPAKGRVVPLGPHLAAWREEYYNCLGWDIET